MKTTIRKTLTAVAFAIGFTTAATAATPIAVWDGNFPVADVVDQGFTLTYNGNTRGTDGKNITIADTAGLGVTFAKSGMAATTVAVKYSGYTGSTTANETLGTFSAGTAANRVGIHRYADGTIYGSHTSGNLTNSKDEGTGSFAGSTNKDVFFLRYSSNGVSIFAKDGTCLYRNGGYKFTSDFNGTTPVYAFTVGGASTQTFADLAAATGMEITGVAVFNAELTSAEMAAYMFPSDPLYGYHYNGNGNAYTPSSFTTSSSGNFVDGFLDQAMWINGNAGYGSGLSIGDNDFTVVFVAKSANTQNKIFFGLGSKSAAGFGFVSNGSSGLKFGNWSSSSLVFDQALNVASGQDATADYHTYVVKYVKSETKAYYSVDGSDYTEISTAMVWSNNGNWQIGSIYGGTVGSYAAGNAGAMDELRIYQKCLSIDDVKAIVKEFSPSETYTATIPTGDVAFEDITWDDSKTWSSGSKVQAELTLLGDTTLTLDANYTGRKLAIKSTAGQKLTLNTAGNGFKFLDLGAAAGKVVLAGIDGLELAKNAVAGAPYSYWIGSTVTGEGNLETPVVPPGYTIALNTVPGVGSRFVVTAPAAAKFGSININFAGGRNSVTFNDEAKVGSQTTMQGGYPVIGTSWNDLEAKNYTGTATKYIDTDGTVKTDGNVSVAVSQCNNPYTTGQDSDKETISYGYIDDGGHPIINISNIPFAKYRVIVYRASDDGSTRTFSAVQIGTTSSNTKIYYGPTQSSTAGGLTIRGTSEVVWGYNKQTGYTEGMNYIVSDVLTGTAGSATAYIYSHKHAGRAGVAAVQIVEVGVGVVPQRATFSMSVWDTTSEKQLISANKYAGYLPVAGAFWDQIEGTDHNGNPFSRDVNLTMYKSDGTTTANAANVTVSGNNTYMTGGTKTTGNGELTYNFIDDAQYQSTGRAGGFSFSNIPFTKYTVYVYMGSDSSNTSELLGPVNVKIGDTTTAYPSGGESGWGGRGYTREISGVLTFDATKNMVVIENMTASAFELTGSLNGNPANTRGGIAGIQIVDTSDPVAQIGINLYGSLNEAAAAVTSGGTIKLVAACNQALTTDKTFTLDLNGFAYNGELAVGSAGAVTLKNDSAFAGTITGAGTIVYDGNGAGTLPTAPAGVTANTWTGTVWLKNYTVNAFDFSAFANSGSKVKLTGMRGYASPGEVENDLELVLEDDGDTKALTITDGYGNTRFSVTRLSGDGTFVAAGSQDAQSQYRFKDASKFAGAFDLSQMGSNKLNKRVIIGTGSDTLADPGCILVEAGAAVTIAAGKTWKVGDTKTITVNGSIGGAGTLGSNTTFGNGAEIVTTNGTLKATGTLTFNPTSTKVRVAAQPAEGSLTTVIAKSGLSEADIDTVVSVYVGDSETADASMQYKLVSNANGVCLSAPAREHLTWNGTAWETAGGQPVATIASYHVLESHAGDNITFSAATAPYAFVLPTTGEVTVNGQNYLTVDAVEIPADATLTLGSDAVPGFSVTGEGTLAYNPGSTPESATVVAADKLSGFTGTFWLKSGRHGYSSAIADAVKIKVTDRAQLYIGGGTWNNAFTLSGRGYKRTTGNNMIDYAAMRLDGTLGASATVTFVEENDEKPVFASHNGGTVNGTLTGCGFRKYGSGQITLAKPKTQATGITSDIIVDYGTLRIGNANNSGCGANDEVTIGTGIVVNSGATLSVHCWTTAAQSAVATDKVKILSPITIHGGSLNVPDGGHAFMGAVTIDGTVSGSYGYHKGWLFDNLIIPVGSTFNASCSSDGSYDLYFTVLGGNVAGTLNVTNGGGNNKKMYFGLSGAALANGVLNVTANGGIGPYIFVVGDATLGQVTGNAQMAFGDGLAARTLTLNGGTYGFVIQDTEAGANAGAALSLVVAGTSTLTAANTYTGGTTVSGGTLALGDADSLGTGNMTVASGATLNVGSVRPTSTLNGTSQGIYAMKFDAAEYASYEAGTPVEMVAVSGGAFAGSVKVYDPSGAELAVGTTSVDPDTGKLKVTKPLDARVPPFGVTNPSAGNWTAAAWKDSTTPDPLDVRNEDWNREVVANIANEAAQTATLTADRALTLSTLNITNGGTLAISAATPNTLAAGTLCITNTGTLTISGDVTVANAIDDSASTGTTTLDFATGTANITAGANTILCGTGAGTLTVGAGKKATVNSGATVGTIASNAGTVRYEEAFAEAKAFDSVMPVAGAYEFKKATINGNGDTDRTIVVPEGDEVTLKSDNDDVRAYMSLKVTGGTVYLGAKDNAAIWYGKSNSKFEMTDGLVVVRATGTAASGNNNGFLLGVSGAPTTFGISGGTLAVANSFINFWSATTTINLTGSGVIKAKGVFKGSSAGVVNVGSGATFEIGSLGWRANSAMFTLNGGTLKALEDAAYVANAMAIAANSVVEVPEGMTLTLSGALTGSGAIVKTGAGKLVLSGNNSAFTGLIDVQAGSVETMTKKSVPGAAYSNMKFAADTSLTIHEDIAYDGLVDLTYATGSANPTVTFYDANGNVQELNEGRYEQTLYGAGTWFDYSFNVSLGANNRRKSVGENTTELSRDTSKGLSGVEATCYPDDNAIYTATDCHMGPTYPAEWSASIYATLPKYQNAVLMAFGTTSGGSIALLCGDWQNDEVILARTTGNSAYETLTTMKVPNAFASKHLYTFCKSDKQIKIYLDKKLWKTYDSATSITFGNGFQFGSLHGGVAQTGYVQYGNAIFDQEANHSVVDSLRLYKGVLGPNAVSKLSDEFGYTSPNGTYSRTFGSAAAFWEADGQWLKVSDQTMVGAPAANATVEVTAQAEATVGVNLAADTTYEALEFTGSEVLTIAPSGIEGRAGKIKCSGTVGIYSSVYMYYAAIDISGGPLAFGEAGYLCIDLRSINLAKYYENANIELTGEISSADAERIIAVNPTAVAGRSVEIGYDSTTHNYRLKITVDKTEPFIYTVPQDAQTGTWSFHGLAVTEEEMATVTSGKIRKAGPGKATLPRRANFTYEVAEGTLGLEATGDYGTINLLNENARVDVGTRRNASLVTVGGSGKVDVTLTAEEDKYDRQTGALFTRASGATATFGTIADSKGGAVPAGQIVVDDTKITIKPIPTVFTVTQITTTAQTNFNGSAVTVAYSKYEKGDYNVVTAKLTIAGHDYVYEGELQAEGGTITFQVANADALASNVVNAVVSVVGSGTTKSADDRSEAYSNKTYLYQGLAAATGTNGWFSTYANGSTVVANPVNGWGDRTPTAKDSKIIIDEDEETEEYVDYVFTPGAAPQAGQATVVDMTLSFDAALDNVTNVYDVQAAVCLVTTGADAYRFAAVTNGVWTTNTTIEAALGTDYALRLTLDYRSVPATVKYELKVGDAYQEIAKGVSGTTKSALANVTFNGSGKLAVMTGSNIVDTVDASLVEDGSGNKYANVDQALAAAGATGLKLLWDASWNPSQMRAGTWTLTANGHKLYTTTDGVKVTLADGVYTVIGDYWEVANLLFGATSVTTNKFMYFTNALALAESEDNKSYTNFYLLRDVTLPANVKVWRNTWFNGEDRILSGATPTFAQGNPTFTIEGGCIGFNPPKDVEPAASGIVLKGGRFTEAGKTAWNGYKPSGYVWAQLATPVRTVSDDVYEFQPVPSAIAPTSAAEELLPVTDANGESVSVVVKSQWAADVTGKGVDDPAAQSAVLSTKQGNGLTYLDNAILGLADSAAAAVPANNIPVITPHQSSNASKVTFSLGNVKQDTITASGARVKYRVYASATPGGKDTAVSEATEPSAEVSVDLPESGVQYYIIEVDTGAVK